MRHAVLFLFLFLFSGITSLSSGYSQTVDCVNATNTTCVYIVNEDEFGTKNYLLAIFYLGIVAFWLFVWQNVKDYKSKGRIWESPANFFFNYTKFAVWFWLVMILIFWLRLIFASHTADYFNQVIAWWQLWTYITMFPYGFFVLYYAYRWILSLPPFQNIIRDIKEWFK